MMSQIKVFENYLNSLGPSKEKRKKKSLQELVKYLCNIKMENSFWWVDLSFI